MAESSSKIDYKSTSQYVKSSLRFHNNNLVLLEENTNSISLKICHRLKNQQQFNIVNAVNVKENLQKIDLRNISQSVKEE